MYEDFDNPYDYYGSGRAQPKVPPLDAYGYSTPPKQMTGKDPMTGWPSGGLTMGDSAQSGIGRVAQPPATDASGTPQGNQPNLGDLLKTGAKQSSGGSVLQGLAQAATIAAAIAALA